MFPVYDGCSKAFALTSSVATPLHRVIPMPLEIGSRLGHYDVTALIGEGACQLKLMD